MIKRVRRSDVLLPVEWPDRFNGRFRTRTHALDLGAAEVVELTRPSPETERAPGLIGQTRPGLCSVVLARHGALRVGQLDRKAVLDAGDFALCEGSWPFDVRNTGHAGATVVCAQVPRSTLPLSALQIDRLLTTRISGQGGAGALFTQFLSRVIDDRASYRSSDVARLGLVALDLLAVALARHLDAPVAQPPEESRHRALLLSVEAFIREHLHDPDLSTGGVAAAHHISVSHLHHIFRTRDITVAALIRRQRLEGARRDLADPRALDVPVHRIAARWGFKGHAAFTRTFRAAYGIAPGGYRRRTLGLPTGECSSVRGAPRTDETPGHSGRCHPPHTEVSQ